MNELETFDFKFTEPQVNIIFNALADRPFREAEPLITMLREQFIQQKNAPEEPATEEEDAE